MLRLLVLVLVIAAVLFIMSPRGQSKMLAWVDKAERKVERMTG